MSKVAAGRRAQLIPTLVHLKGPAAEDRVEAESFVRHGFQRAYHAEISQFMPTLMGLRSDSGVLLAVLGLRDAQADTLFLEHYLDMPAEQALSAAVGGPIDRAGMVEVGNFAVGAAGGGRWLITALTAYLHTAGRNWAIFTCGPELRNAFGRLGIELIDIATAKPTRLPGDQARHWGTYYDQQPRVMAANVAHSHQVLAALFDHECTLRALWQGALQAGGRAA